ncbi:hypothetical protein P879_04835 [Paragonimus westermani]|uniref:Uncharacterized protein n=1 Tax=Paragonimus westermani TaxID=34504 RepID=A0A8T0DDC0_9TREM|nr:hypothetical protein P879_04835 [Paragonimus westermani]
MKGWNLFLATSSKLNQQPRTRNPEVEVVAYAVEQQLYLPKREIQRPGDNPNPCWSFTEEFQIAVEGKTTDNQARLTYWTKCYDDLVKVAISHYTVLHGDAGQE